MIGLRKIRIGVIGGGGFSRASHIVNYKKLNDKVELVALADVNEQIVKQNLDEFGFQYGFTDYAEMLADVELDAVSVCTPNKFHAPATIAALNAGCHVLCVKPPAMTGAEAIAMKEAADKAGKILTYGFNFRHTNEAQILKRFVDAGELGRIYTGRVSALRRSGIASWGAFTNKELQGGGPLIDIGVHMLDLALYLMGYPKPKTIMGVTYQELGNRPLTPTWGGRWDYKNISIEDMATAMIIFENGASLQLETSFIGHMKELDVMNITLHGTEGGCNFSPLSIFQDKHGTLIDITPAYIPDSNAGKSEIETFVNAVSGQGELICTADEGIKVQQIIEGIYRSAETGETVHFQ
ncbi:Gfo/Idh/MocA family protein [Paenibacillus montanisoli]|uniref:Gfo/Idh/MocA family oxidoreductase n=1 Tax=Paenibacillus montanisoli TaxID=2081970 RepID=A0A328U7A1_9BACL|nr:Gfo/Idh/MocA family oxidoreductase [Paenibacillus montanisoli]RAP78429.1 gfo/Idh/MocA family oxidoreductase [Paenibacillus montanisoli]